MSTTNMPGFTAEASLCNGPTYQATPVVADRHGLITPAVFVDEMDLDEYLPFAALGPTTHGNCRRPVCIHYAKIYPGLPVCDQWIWIWTSCWP